MREEVRGLMDKLKMNTTLYMGSIHPSSLKELRYESVDLLISTHDFLL